MEVAKEKFRGMNILIFTFNFGSRNGEDAFKHILQATPEHPDKSVFLHPVLQSIDKNGQMIEELHLLENLDTTWNDNELHVKPLKSYIERNFPFAEKAATKCLDLHIA